MKKLYAVDGVVVAVGWAVNDSIQVKSAHDHAVCYEVADDAPAGIGWAVVNEEGNVSFAPPAALPPTVGPNEFHFLWTIAEQVAIEEVRVTDKGVDLFMKRLEDARTLEVVLAAPPVQAGIKHTLDALATHGTITSEQVPIRLAQILSGSWGAE